MKVAELCHKYAHANSLPLAIWCVIMPAGRQLKKANLIVIGVYKKATVLFENRQIVRIRSLHCNQMT